MMAQQSMTGMQRKVYWITVSVSGYRLIQRITRGWCVNRRGIRSIAARISRSSHLRSSMHPPYSFVKMQSRRVLVLVDRRVWCWMWRVVRRPLYPCTTVMYCIKALRNQKSVPISWTNGSWQNSNALRNRSYRDINSNAKQSLTAISEPYRSLCHTRLDRTIIT